MKENLNIAVDHFKDFDELVHKKGEEYHVKSFSKNNIIYEVNIKNSLICSCNTFVFIVKYLIEFSIVK